MEPHHVAGLLLDARLGYTEAAEILGTDVLTARRLLGRHYLNRIAALPSPKERHQNEQTPSHQVSLRPSHARYAPRTLAR